MEPFLSQTELLYGFSEQTATGAPGRRGDDGAARAGDRLDNAERRETICVIREALEALIRLLAPFAQDSAQCFDQPCPCHLTRDARPSRLSVYRLWSGPPQCGGQEE